MGGSSRELKNEYSWKVHPFSENRYKAIFVIIVFIAFAKLSYDFTDSFFMAIFGLLLLFMSLRQFFLPTVYTIDSEKIVIKNLFGPRIEKLSKFHKFFKDKNGIFLSAEPDSKVLDQFRGLFLLAGAADKEAVIEILKGVFKDERTHG
ncbi:MAG TPA: hypothetical protein PKK26_07845 [Candidatus Wallbacteria bacterium]|nr:hypothetical protein [Candidatus Wallbacteria bacterium]